jgi:hypothetical protein
VLHFGESGSGAKPCEAAYLARPADGCEYISPKLPKVRVFVSPTLESRMSQLYSPLGPNVTVSPLRFTDAELDAESVLTLMGMRSTEKLPLYLHTLLVSSVHSADNLYN